MVKEDITKIAATAVQVAANITFGPFYVFRAPLADSGQVKIFLHFHWTWPSGRGQTNQRGALQMEMEISEKIQRLTRILSEEANKFPRITVDQYSTGTYGYDWKVYLDRERQLGTIAFTTDVTLSEKELRAAFRHELKALVRNQVASPVPALTAGPR
jgi:hypothetical protein